MPKKYITVNGVLQKNPEYVEPGKGAPPQPDVALAVVSTPEDVMAASTVQAASTGITVPMASSAAAAVDMLQDDEILAHYKSRAPLDGGAVMDQLAEKFAKYEVPLGMVNKLMMLMDSSLDFLVDDSGSMDADTDVRVIDATEPVKGMAAERIKLKLRREINAGDKLRRIEEAEDRLHIMLGILAYVPVENMQIRFLTDRRVVKLERAGKTPEQFEEYAHRLIRDTFSTLRLAPSTPLREPLKAGFAYEGKWCHYVFNDGVPDGGGEAVAQMIIDRKRPADHNVTLLSCTDNDDDTAWMKLVDGKAKWVAELDDYQDEKDEVMKKQGKAFPFTRGLWILNQLVAAFNPFDLDALDENLPLTRFTLSNILGRQLNPREYQYYFENNPSASLYVKEYKQFLTEEKFARDFIKEDDQKRREKAAGYVDGEPPRRALPDLSRYLNTITEEAQTAFARQFPSAPEPAPAPRSAVSIAPSMAFMPDPASLYGDAPPPYCPEPEEKSQ